MNIFQKTDQELLDKAQHALNQVKDLAAQDPTRPFYHAICPANWMNDPNGPIYIDGKYHVFYQHNPHNPIGGPMYWGHMESYDLLHWIQVPIAFSPSPKMGEESCWSGTCIIGPQNRPAILYTSIGKTHDPKMHAEQWLAWGSNDLLKWTKEPSNPVMKLDLHSGKLPPNCHIEEWRDPYAWKGSDGVYYVVCGGHIACEKVNSPLFRNPTVFLYRSTDLIHWEFLNPLYSRFNDGQNSKGDAGVNLGENWECPNFFPIENKWVLIVSNTPPIAYCIGEFKDNRFIPTQWHLLDHSGLFYAPNSLQDNLNRRILIGWVRGCKGDHWQGCFSLPRWLSLRADNTLMIQPIPEIIQLRNGEFHQNSILIPENNTFSIPEIIKDRYLQQKIQAGTVEMKLKFQRNTLCKQNFSLEFYDISKFGIQGSFTWDAESEEFFIGSEGGKYLWESTEDEIELDIWIDRSVIEIFINQHWTITHAYNLAGNDHLKLIVRSEGNPLLIKNFDFWGISLL